MKRKTRRYLNYVHRKLCADWLAWELERESTSYCKVPKREPMDFTRLYITELQDRLFYERRQWMNEQRYKAPERVPMEEVSSYIAELQNRLFVERWQWIHTLLYERRLLCEF